MKLSNILSPLSQLWFGLTIAFVPTLKAMLRNPALLFSPREVSRTYMANLWLLYGDGLDGNAKPVKEQLITPHAFGSVLDIGAGHGHTVRYLDRTRVSRYIAVEPNELMHGYIREQAHKFGFQEADGSLVIISCGAEETQVILSKLAPISPSTELEKSRLSIDTIVSVLTLCTVPRPQKCVADLVREVLNPEGYFLMYEHVLSPRADTAWWQRFWAPIWALGFDGCRMDRPSDVLVSGLTVTDNQGQEKSAWKESTTWAEGELEEENFFFHSFGVFVKN